MFKLLGIGVMAHLGLMKLLNNRGEAGGAGDGGEGNKGGGAEGKTFTQADLDRIVGERLARLKNQYSDYDDLKKFKDEHAKEQDKIKQDELVRQKKYEEAEGTYKKQIGDLQSVVTQKDQTIQDLNIRHALIGEITKQNGYVEESLALLRSAAVVTKDGNIIIKTRDANGIEKEVSVEEGVKGFLGQRPHLVKAQGGTGGGGNPPENNAGGGGSGQGDDLASLNRQFYAEMSKPTRDIKKIEEIKKKMAPLMKGNRFAI